MRQNIGPVRVKKNAPNMVRLTIFPLGMDSFYHHDILSRDKVFRVKVFLV